MAIVRLSDIHKTYSGPPPFQALKGISLSIKQGEFVSIMGPSGSGKTTLLDIFGCISSPSSGEYLLEGERVDSLTAEGLAKIRNRKIGFIFQNFHLLPGYNLLENVGLPLIYSGIDKQERQQRARETLITVGLEGKEQNLPNQISGGQRQRVAIARALINQPAILLADEPTGSLDSKTGQDILALFHHLNQAGSTIILITHDAGIGSQASRSLLLKDGEIYSP